MTGMLAMAGLIVCGAVSETTVDLAGTWRVRLDREDLGIAARWYGGLPGENPEVRLPGSLDEHGTGDPFTEPAMGRLTRETSYVGPAWYQREIDIPASWEGRPVELFLERGHWETRVWLDDHYVGMDNSLSTPQTFDLTTFVRPGRHTITLRIDNALLINVGHTHGGWMWAHALTDETQTNWNGVIGEMTLRAHDSVRVRRVQTWPDPEGGEVRVVALISSEEACDARVEAVAVCGDRQLGPVMADASLAPGENTVTLVLPIGPDTPLWDEFTPNLHDLTLTVTATVGDRVVRDRVNETFGIRSFKADGHHFTLNGRRVHLRGTLECCIFPLTGYPPTDPEAWERIFSVIRDHGMNHVRFHSWCPPRAAFVAADRAGMLLQIENPLWDGYGNIGADTRRANYIAAEAERIIDTYGNHPSFVLMSMGNELGEAREKYLQYLVEHLRERDPRRLYTCTTHPVRTDGNDDYSAGAATEVGAVRGLQPPVFSSDYDAPLASEPRPVVAHEVGQYPSLPDFRVAEKYTGHLKARYLDVFLGRFLEHHPEVRLAPFVKASEAFAGVLYKTEIEAQMRTSLSAGFQLLGLQDFPGQGVALVGLLDPFWDSKGIFTPEQFRSFCGPAVALARFEKAVWTSGETFHFTLDARNGGPANLPAGSWEWRVIGPDGDRVASGHMDGPVVPPGHLAAVGAASIPMAGLAAPAEHILEAGLPGVVPFNSWRFWVIPEDTAEPAFDALVTSSFDAVARDTLARGGNVLFLAKPGELIHSRPTRFYPLFWASQLFAGQKAGLGLLINDKHPALASFPTRDHADWQWRDLTDGAWAVETASLGVGFEPVIHQIDDFNTNDALALLFEATCGSGRLLVCSLNLGEEGNRSPAQRQFVASLAAYMGGPSFLPSARIAPEQLATLLAPNPRRTESRAPALTEATVLHVRAAVNADAGVAKAWTPAADEVVRAEPGFGHMVGGSVWRDAGGSAWHGQQLEIGVSVPSDFEGTLHVHLHDWNSQGRVAHLYYDGRDLGPIAHYDGDGIWINLPVTREQAARGAVRLTAHTEGGPNVMITALVLESGMPATD